MVIQAAKDDIVWVPRGDHAAHSHGGGRREHPPPGDRRNATALHIYHDCEQCGYADDGPREWCA